MDNNEHILTIEDRSADGEIAITLNGIEDLQFIDKPGKKKFRGLLSRLEKLKEGYPNRFLIYIDEIVGVVDETRQHYFKIYGGFDINTYFLN